jgi:hypothetical protein
LISLSLPHRWHQLERIHGSWLDYMLVNHGCIQLVCRGHIFDSKLIEGLEIGVIPMLFLIIQSLEVADDAASDVSSSTRLNLVLWAGDCSISRVVQVGREIHDVIL